jgi:ribosomal protein S18 acetylase RimI-like enzyme
VSEVSVRRATPSDIPGAAELAGRLARMHHETDPARFFLPERVVEGYAWWFERVLQDAEAVLLVAEVEGVLAGYAYGGLEERAWNLLLDEHGAIHDLYVTEERRRAGVGQALLAAILAELERLGAERIVLSTMPSNLAAQRLFARFGFRVTFLEMTRNRPAAG